MIINHNMASLNTYRQLSTNNANTGKSLEKLSSGLRINKAGDDAAGLAISEKMRGQIRGLDQASRNAQDGISLINTAEGSLSETHSILQRMRELATQASSDTNVTVDREEIQKEVNQLTSEVNRIGNTTEFNTMKLLNGDRANTLTVSGVRFSGGSTVATNAGTTGLDVTLTGGAGALADGSHTLEITSTRETRAVQTVTPQLAGYKSTTGNAATAVFDGNKIATTAGTVTADSDITLTWDDTKQGFKLTGTLTNGGTGNVTFGADEYAFIGQEYNNHGLKFTLTDKGTMANGNTAVITVKAAGGDIATKQDGYLTHGTTTAATFTGGITLTDEKELSALAGGKVRLTVAAASIKVELLDKGGNVIENDTIAQGTANYDNHGVKFNISGAAVGGTNDVIEIGINSDTFKVEGKLDGGAAVTLATGYNGSATTGSLNGGGSIAGMTLAQSAKLQAGTYTFTSEANVSGSDESLNFQIGANQGQFMNVDINDMRAEALKISSDTVSGDAKTATGVDGAAFVTTKTVTDGTSSKGAEYALDVSSSTKATAAIKVLDNAIKSVSSERSKLGANTNRLEHTITNLGTSSENLTAAESRIRDVDMAKEMMNFQKNNILQQAAQAMLAQANQQPQGVLQLLR